MAPWHYLTSRHCSAYLL
ncbi:unnamed protein product [Acanthoscelides obtectus]|uniref:Uncharacterized protein n=1 Tax=Acanthoscelides obtectus TaxID=200917 RepID=A0A9P0KGW1_ACAOB|nr:unnamed protein product [Acanthoscelides obtectus]CAK1627674.1 hypothetical protein AOBTE_LOCUS4759 [Acanthoscelides obtectus]